MAERERNSERGKTSEKGSKNPHRLRIAAITALCMFAVLAAGFGIYVSGAYEAAPEAQTLLESGGSGGVFHGGSGGGMDEERKCRMTGNRMIEAVVFDMDGVLFDTERISCECCFQTAKEMGLKMTEEAVYGSCGRNQEAVRAHVIASMEPWYPNGSFPYDEYWDEVNRHFFARLDEELPLMKGVTELLDFLKERGKKLAVASSTKLEQVQKNLRRNGLDCYFDVVVGGDMIRASKPAPDIYLEACRRLSVQPEHAAGIEDSFNGIRSVAAAGMLAVMIPDMLQPDEEIQKVYDHCFVSLEELKNFWETEGI